MNLFKKVLLVVSLAVASLVPSAMFAADPTDTAGVVTAVKAIPADATAGYISAAVLGLGIFTVSIIFYVVRRGVKAR